MEDLEDLYCRSRGEGFGDEVKRRIMTGTYVLSAGYYDAYYLKAQQVRQLIADDFRQAFADVDVIAGPTAPSPAFRLGDKVDDPIQMYLNDIYTIGANLAGLPAISVPCGFVNDLPVGLHLVAPHFAEGRVVAGSASVPGSDGMAHGVSGGIQMSAWEVVIGLEVHTQLATQSKIFSAAATQYGAEPNSQACLVDLGVSGRAAGSQRRGRAHGGHVRACRQRTRCTAFGVCT